VFKPYPRFSGDSWVPTRNKEGQEGKDYVQVTDKHGYYGKSHKEAFPTHNVNGYPIWADRAGWMGYCFVKGNAIAVVEFSDGDVGRCVLKSNN